MSFLTGDTNNRGNIELQDKLTNYYSYIEAVKDKMPFHALSFTMASWHYDHADSRCPHDSWLESISIDEISSGERSEMRRVDIKIGLKGAYHDGHIYLTYKQVIAYSLQSFYGTNNPNPACTNLDNGHGDWYIDEVRLSESGHVIHEIHFATGVRWFIESRDIIYEWKPLK